MGPELEEQKQTLLKYYQNHAVNPVLIPVEDEQKWTAHVLRRQNLYTHHLMIPPLTFRDANVLEFGCNSGENALFLASLGARLSLVEPNCQVLPRLKELFKRFDLEDRIIRIENQTLEAFETTDVFDVVIAEGFLHTLQNRETALTDLCRLIRPGGIGIISYDDRFGSFIELLRVLVLHEVCRLKRISDLHGATAFGLAQRLFEDDFNQINASRSFRSWWMDNLVNPYTSGDFFWSYPGFLPIIESAGCCFHSCSPKWTEFDHYTWYKNITSIKQRHDALLHDWTQKFMFFITGIRLQPGETPTVSADMIETVSEFIHDVSIWILNKQQLPHGIRFPEMLTDTLIHSQNDALKNFGMDLQHLFQVLKSENPDQIITAYLSLNNLRNLWGSALNYICFTRLSGQEIEPLP
jgi:SAM-dependent methyltransferase